MARRRTAGRTALAERRCGRLGGAWHPQRPVAAAVLERMRLALGPDAQILGSPGEFADADACWHQDQPASLPQLLDTPSEIDGAFVAARIGPDGLRLVRDAIGHRSLYWTQTPDGTVLFASSLHGILASGLIERRLHLAAVPTFLAYAYTPGTATLAAGVQALPAGTVLRADARGVRLDPVWQLPAVPTQFADETTLRRQLRQTLAQAVQRALPPPGEPLVATLSGGIDSSLVLALARQQHVGDLTCLSVSFGAGHANELAFSTLVADHLHVRQDVVTVTPADVAAQFDATVAARAEPNGDPLTVPNTLLFRRAAELGRVVLNGEGGDPCFGGPKNAPMLLAELLDDEGDFLTRERRYLTAHQRCYDDLAAMLEPDLLATLADDRLARDLSPWFADPRWPRLLDQLMAVNVAFKGSHHILPKVDHLGFPMRVLPRSPLFDRQVVALSFAVPAGLKRRGAVEKHLLKEAVRDLLPQSIVERPKSGMLVPVEAWFQGPLRDFAGDRLGALAARGLVRRAWIADLLGGRMRDLRPRRGIKVWQLLTLEAWLRTVLEGRQGSGG